MVIFGCLSFRSAINTFVAAPPLTSQFQNISEVLRLCVQWWHWGRVRKIVRVLGGCDKKEE